MLRRLVNLIGRLLAGMWEALDLTRRLVLNALFLVLLVALIAALARVSRDPVPDRAVLVLNPTGRLVEQEPRVSPALLLLQQGLDEGTSADTPVRPLVEALDRARLDARIDGMLLDLRRLEPSGFSQLEAVAAALARWRSSGKPVVSWSDQYTPGQYYLAAHAGSIYLHPMGAVELHGFGVYRTYFRAALERLRVEVHTFRVGTYKSALEPFLRDDMSPADRDASLAWLNSRWQAWRTALASQRQLAPEAIDGYIDNWRQHLARTGGDAAQVALDEGLVDGVEPRSDTMDRLPKPSPDSEALPLVTLRTYQNGMARRPRARAEADTATGQVGVIVATGIIMSGRQPSDRIGDESLGQLLQQAADAPAVRAVVLRLDTPGGSALASETLYQAVARLRHGGKPVVASLGSTAASGGYWVAVAADQIWASPTTLTGSIGIFGAFPTLERSLDAVGIHADGVGTHARAAELDPRLPLAEDTGAALQLRVDWGYREFVARVATGRHLDSAAVEAAAQGRVWTGEQALALGLVDSLGSLDQSIAAAARLAGMTSWHVHYLAPEVSASEQLWRALAGQVSVQLPSPLPAPVLAPVTALATEAANTIGLLLGRADPQGLYAWCLTCTAE